MQPEQITQQPTTTPPYNAGNMPGQNPPAPGKRRLFFVVGIVVAVLLLVGGGFAWAQSAKSGYKKATAVYKEELKHTYEEIDGADPATDDEVAAAMKESYQKLEATLKSAPKPAKVVFISVTPSDAQKEVQALTDSATKLATAFKNEYELLLYEVNLNKIVDEASALHSAVIGTTEELESLPANWDRLTKDLKALLPPAAAQETHDELVTEFEELKPIIDASLTYYAIPDFKKFTEVSLDFYSRASDLQYIVAGVAEAHTTNTEAITKYFDQLGKLVQ